MKNEDYNWYGFIKDASGDVRRLDYVDRFSTVPISCKETVAAHSYWVALYAAMVHRELNGPDRLTGRILESALVHDVTESLSGDFNRLFKYSSTELKNAIKLGEDKMMHLLPKIIQSMSNNSDLDLEDQHYIDQVVKAGDWISLHQFLTREWNRGNSEIRPFYERMIRDLLAESEKVSYLPSPGPELSKLYKMLTEFKEINFTT